MKKILFMAVAAASVLTGCQKSDVSSEGRASAGDSFTGVFDTQNAVQTGSDDVTFKWSDGDEVSINGVPYTVSAGEGSSVSLTEKKAGVGAAGSSFKAFYADGSCDGVWADGNYVLPASYGYVEGKLNMPMYAENSSRELNFRSLCGVLKLSLTSSKVSCVSKIVVTSDSRLNGQFTADADGELTFSSDAASVEDRTVTVDFATPVTLGKTATCFYVPVAPGSHKLTVEVYDGEDCSTISMQEACSFSRGILYPLSDTGGRYTGGKASNAR